MHMCPLKKDQEQGGGGRAARRGGRRHAQNLPLAQGMVNSYMSLYKLFEGSGMADEKTQRPATLTRGRGRTDRMRI